MLVFLRNIPGNTLRSDIVKFISPVVKGGFFSAKGEIKLIKIFALKDKVIKIVEHHALVCIEPDDVALRVINKLNNAHFKGKRITVRQYHTRERSSIYPLSHSNQRRELETIELESPQVIGDRKFHRIHHS